MSPAADTILRWLGVKRVHMCTEKPAGMNLPSGLVHVHGSYGKIQYFFPVFGYILKLTAWL
jgi:hypothetical protein